MQHAVQPAYFVPDSVKADVLFRNMRDGHHQFAIVLDEYSGMSGIVTRSDLIEQLVGDLGDDPTHLEIEALGDNTWRIRGSAPLDEVSEALGIPIESEDYDTFNGLIFGALGTVPGDGTQVELDIGPMHIKAIDIRDHQTKLAIVHLTPAGPDGDPEQNVGGEGL